MLKLLVWVVGAFSEALPLPIVCVTGGSGYIATELVGQLLESGKYHVRTTVRNLQRHDKLKPLVRLKGADDRLEVLEADLLKEGSFKGCVADATIVFHTASPFKTAVADPQKDLVDPALKGTENVLRSVAAAGSVKRVVLTSSVAAVMGGVADKDSCFDEDDWNESSKITSKNGLDHYRLSKTLAEKAAWKMSKEHGFEMATINPSFVIGPPRTDRWDSESLLNMKVLLEGKDPPRGATPMVDVRDVAAAHLRAAEMPEAAGHRFIMSTPYAIKKEEVLRIVSAEHPEYAIVDLGDPQPATREVFCSKTLGSILKMTLRPYADSLREMADVMLLLGSATPQLKHHQGL